MDNEENFDEMEESADEENSDNDDMSSEDENEDDTEDSLGLSKVYLPGSTNDKAENLECDETAYLVYHKANTGAPCLSFDIIKDDLGDDRAEKYPLTAYIVGGTQGERTHVNNLIVMKLSNIGRNKPKNTDDDDDEDSDSDIEGENMPELEHAMVPHRGCVNRIKVTNINGRQIAASWSELKNVYLWDLSRPLEAVNDPRSMGAYVRNGEVSKPIFTFKGHHNEGFAVDWSPVQQGVLATGDCSKNIHIWKPHDGGTWLIDQRAFTAHSASVEDLQWSPNEANVLASCSVDRSIRIWDTRAAPAKACMLTNSSAHDSDVNVISWNKLEPFILSGGDDGCLKVWDLRQFQKNKPVCIFKHHVSPITSVEWHPTDPTVFCASGEDNQVTLWDLSVEKDSESELIGGSKSEVIGEDAEVAALPPQLLFIHQGQKDIKELHWHPQMPGIVISTALCGLNVFRTISV